MERLLAMEIEKIEVDLNELGVDNRMPESFKADFLRWRLLATAGGLWSDFDIIYFKPMESLYLNLENTHFSSGNRQPVFRPKCAGRNQPETGGSSK